VAVVLGHVVRAQDVPGGIEGGDLGRMSAFAEPFAVSAPGVWADATAPADEITASTKAASSTPQAENASLLW
jgi:hypothetical protein